LHTTASATVLEDGNHGRESDGRRRQHDSCSRETLPNYRRTGKGGFELLHNTIIHCG
jgi:hypothetical protein